MALAWAVFLCGVALLIPQFDFHVHHSAVKAIVATVYTLFLIATPVALTSYFNQAWRKVGTLPNRTAYVIWLTLESIAAISLLAVLAYANLSLFVVHFR
jgi:hypothetical protein